MSNDFSDQFTNPTLVAAYDALNGLGDDRDFWVAEIERLAPKTIIDLGCGQDSSHVSSQGRDTK